MVQDDVPADGWLPLALAAEQLGLSIHAVRRRVHTGELPARRVRTRYGLAWQVRLDDEREGSATVAQESREGDEPAPDGPADLMRAEAMAAYTRSLLEPLTAALERSQAEVADLRETAGRLTAELKAERQRATDQAWELARAEASRRRDARWLALALAAVATAALIAVASPAWVR